MAYFIDSTRTIIWEVTTKDDTTQAVRISDMGYCDNSTWGFHGTTFKELKSDLLKSGFTEGITDEEYRTSGFNTEWKEG